ncbi:MAG TPA: DMT family transporter [Candidatus Acidoferrales bacterium]|nr:DMT family transporter [Candidatus Acidoferrales bacterium]
MVLVSAACFGTLAILAKFGYAAGLHLEELLAYRFLIAAAGLWLLALAAGQNPLRLPWRRRLALFGMGSLGYAGQAFSFFSALKTLSASLVELVLYTYPALVALGAWAFFRRPVGGRHWLALGGSLAGVALLLGGLRLGAGPGLLFAAASPLIYTAYILVGDRVMPGAPALAAGALATTGAGLSFLALATAAGRLVLPAGPVAWTIVVAIALVPTMAAVTLFLASLARIGAGRAALLSTLEPVTTVVLAALLLGDRLAPLQVLGGLLVLAAVVVLQWPARPVSQPNVENEMPAPTWSQEHPKPDAGSKE